MRLNFDFPCLRPVTAAAKEGAWDEGVECVSRYVRLALQNKTEKRFL